MLPKPVPLPPGLKASSVALSGQVTSTWRVTHRARDRTETVVGSGSTIKRVEASIGPAYIGKGESLRIPGPEKSYASAEITAYCFLACEQTPGAIRQAYARASKMIQEQLEADSIEVQKFFEEWAAG